MKDNL